MTESSEQELIFGVGSNINSSSDDVWYQENIEILFPVLIILIGIFQFVIRKWILPVPENVISKLENQLPTQALLYKPGFGMFFVEIGIILLLLNLI